MEFSEDQEDRAFSVRVPAKGESNRKGKSLKMEKTSKSIAEKKGVQPVIQIYTGILGVDVL